uniref:Integron gene cassette protein n=1 Tax=Macrostomum lignano TaxID=282301 RepID=A0A1I8FFR4_9PLAT
RDRTLVTSATPSPPHRALQPRSQDHAPSRLQAARNIWKIKPAEGEFIAKAKAALRTDQLGRTFLALPACCSSASFSTRRRSRLKPG